MIGRRVPLYENEDRVRLERAVVESGHGYGYVWWKVRLKREPTVFQLTRMVDTLDGGELTGSSVYDLGDGVWFVKGYTD